MTTVAQLTIEMAADVARLRKDMQKANSTVDGAVDKIKKSAALAVKALGAIGLALSSGALVGMVRDLGRVGNEIQNLSRLAGVTTGTFQQMSFAARNFGVEQDKLADILKDTQDKVGDFLATGAGGMADFFENVAPLVGVTAENFRKLNGADALQLYVSSLQKANLSQAEMTFYMEAIASDSSLLIPLFQNNGKAMKEFADEADRLGIVLDESALENAKKLDLEMKKFEATTDGLSRSIASALIPALTSIAEVSQDIIRELPKLVDEFKPFMVGGAVVAGLYALPGIINSVAFAISTRLIPSLVLLAPYVAVFSALTLAAGSAIKVLNAQSEALKDADSTARRVVNLQKEIEKAQALIDAGQGSSVTVERLKTMKSQLVEAEAALETFNKQKEVSQAVEEDQINQQKTIIKNAKDRGKAEKDLEKAIKDRQKIESDVLNQKIEIIQAEIDSTDEIKAQTKEVIEQTRAIGLNEEGLRSLELAKIDDQIQTTRQRIEMISFGDANDELIKQYKEQIEALEVLKQAKKGLYKKEEAQKVVNENKKVAEAFENDLIDAFENAFNRGGDFAESFKRAIEQQFATMVLRPAINAIVSGGRAGGIGGALGALGGIGGGGALASFASGGAAGFGVNQALQQTGAIFSGGYDIAKFLGASTQSAASIAGTLASTAKAVAPYAGSIVNLLEGNVKGAAGSAIGTAIGNAILPGIGGAIGSFLGGKLFSGSSKISASILDPEFLMQQEDALQQQFASTVSALGGRAANADFFFGGNTGRQGQNPNFHLGFRSSAGQTFTTLQSRAGATGENGTFLASEIALNAENMALFGTRAIVQALQESDFVDNINNLFDEVDARTASLEVLNSLLEDARILDSVNDGLFSFTDGLKQLEGASSETVKSFFELTGGIEGLAQRMDFFFKEFTSEGEQFEKMTRSISEILGEAGGALFESRSQFREFFEQLGPDQFARVSGILGQIDSYYDTLEKRQEEATQESIKQIQKIADFGKQISDYLRGLETGSPNLTPQQRLQASRAEFNRVLGLAQSGEEDALRGITGAADTLIQAGTEFFGSTSGLRDIINLVKGSLASLPGVITQQSLDVQRFTIGSSASLVPQINSTSLVGQGTQFVADNGVRNEIRALREDLRNSGMINVKVVTTDGKVLTETTLDQIRERSRRGELVIYADGVK